VAGSNLECLGDCEACPERSEGSLPRNDSVLQGFGMASEQLLGIYLTGDRAVVYLMYSMNQAVRQVAANLNHHHIKGGYLCMVVSC